MDETKIVSAHLYAPTTELLSTPYRIHSGTGFRWDIMAEADISILPSAVKEPPLFKEAMFNSSLRPINSPLTIFTTRSDKHHSRISDGTEQFERYGNRSDF